MNIRLGDVDTWYDEHGAGEPLVLLHPGGADARTWEANLPPLAERFRVLTPDRRGHGRTPDAGELTFDAMARDTIAFICGLTRHRVSSGVGVRDMTATSRSASEVPGNGSLPDSA